MNPSPESPAPEAQVSRFRAVMCLLLNVIVFPGLGTLTSGDRARRRTGLIQFGLGVLLTPLLFIFGVGGAVIAGVDPDTLKAWIMNFVLILIIWNVITGVQIFRKAMRQAKERGTQSS